MGTRISCLALHSADQEKPSRSDFQVCQPTTPQDDDLWVNANEGLTRFRNFAMILCATKSFKSNRGGQIKYEGF